MTLGDDEGTCGLLRHSDLPALSVFRVSLDGAGGAERPGAKDCPGLVVINHYQCRLRCPRQR